MPKRFIVVLFAVAALLVASLGPAFAGAQTDGATVSTGESPELGTYLTDPEGTTLYMFTKDEPGTSNCTGDCLANWPAFVAEDPLTLPEGVPGELTQITREDGSQQVAYNEMPLYSFAADAAPGDVNGQGVGDAWYVVEPAAGMDLASPAASPVASPVASASTVSTSESPELGTYLTDPEGMTLYLFTKDEPGTSNCTGDCLTNWPPLVASDPLTLPEGVPGELTQITREDGSQQVAYNEMPLYSFAADAAPGDVNGQGVGDAWYVVEPAPGTDLATPAT